MRLGDFNWLNIGSLFLLLAGAGVGVWGVLADQPVEDSFLLLGLGLLLAVVGVGVGLLGQGFEEEEQG